MLKKIFIILSLFLGLTVGTIISSTLVNYDILPSTNQVYLRIGTIVLTIIIFLILSLLLSEKFVKSMKKVEEKLSNVPIQKIIFSTIGLILGLLVATLLATMTETIAGNGILGRIIKTLLYISFAYLGFILGYKREGEFVNTFFKFSNKTKDVKKSKKVSNKNYFKVVDTSSLIDSRIQDVAKTGFLEGEIIVPDFVLKELQLISDSDDPLKRAKGRLGLDCVETLKDNEDITLVIDNKYEYEEHKPVDSLLIDYALKNNCAIITTDYNLNKLATLQSIKVLNVNDLSNAVKPMLTTGEKLTVHILREGKENNQGVAYTEDGTMIVIENGKKYVGKNVDVEVQSVLQTSSGRIIFTKIV